jgi:Fur family peroxide stress response transcriptional regulator
MINLLRNKLKNKGLKVTPQRIAVLEAIHQLNNHPTTDNIIEYVRESHPSIATGTVYKVLDVLVDSGLVSKVKTDKDIMRYDGMTESHHHLYALDSDRIEDYVDEELDEMLSEYFESKEIPDFKIENINLQIKGNFLN